MHVFLTILIGCCILAGAAGIAFIIGLIVAPKKFCLFEKWVVGLASFTLLTILLFATYSIGAMVINHFGISL